MIDHSDDGDGGYYPDEDPFDPSDPKWQPRGGEGGGGSNRYDVPPPAGRYPVIIDRWEMSEEPGASGYHFINMAVSIQLEGNWYNFFIWEILSYSPKSGPRWAALFNALGWTRDHGPFDRTDPNVLAQWFDSGILFWVQTKIETYRGKRKAKIAYYIPRAEQPAMPASGQHHAQQEGWGNSGGQVQGQGREDYPDQGGGGGGFDPFGGNPNAHDDRPHDGAPGPGYPGAEDPDDDMPF